MILGEDSPPEAPAIDHSLRQAVGTFLAAYGPAH